MQGETGGKRDRQYGSRKAPRGSIRPVVAPCADNVQAGGSAPTSGTQTAPPSGYFKPRAWSTGLGQAQQLAAKGGILARMLQRLIDVFGSGILILLAAPLFLITALAIWSVDRGPVFYRQTRAGLLGRPFELLKFRSMQVNNLALDDVTEIREGHTMVTPVGRWIRRFKVDELPQLFNVLRGDMALIGPRPTVPEQVEKYTAFERRRLSIAPGMTGWAQVNGGIELTWPERIMLDIWYADHHSYWMDARILWGTAAVILFGDERNPEELREATVYANQERGGTELDLPLPSLTSTDNGDHASGGDAADRARKDSWSRGGSKHPKFPSGGAVNA